MNTQSPCAKKSFDVGGQAVMEGVMMRSPTATAVTVRRPDRTMVTKLTPFTPLKEKHPWMGKPFLRGIVNMATMLYYGMNTIQDSTTMLGLLDEEPSRFEKWLAKKLGKSVDKIVMAVAIVLAVAMAVGLFIVVPDLVKSALTNKERFSVLPTLAQGLVKIVLLIGYMMLCSLVPDVRRTFQYHGAEHKSVHCQESDLPLTPENAQTFSRLHPRCGTAFLLIVFLVSVALLFVPNWLLNGKPFYVQFLAHLAMIPVIAGISYEILMGLAHSKGKLARILRAPGMQMQRLTTREPDPDMLECAIVSVNVVLNGFPENCPKTPEGWGIFHSYQESEPGYVFPVPSHEESPAESEAETDGSTKPDAGPVPDADQSAGDDL